MKKKYIIAIGIIILIIIGLFCFIKNKDKISEEDLNMSNIESFYITYTNGYMAYSYTNYQIINKDGVYLAKIKPNLVNPDDTLEIELDSSVIKEITEVLKKYHVNKWDGFDKDDKGVLDGDSFSLYIRTLNNKSISASGYMMWPDNYNNVVKEINDIFMRIYNEKRS